MDLAVCQVPRMQGLSDLFILEFPDPDYFVFDTSRNSHLSTEKPSKHTLSSKRKLMDDVPKTSIIIIYFLKLLLAYGEAGMSLRFVSVSRV